MIKKILILICSFSKLIECTEPPKSFTTIFAPTPLLELQDKTLWEKNHPYIKLIKQIALPASCLLLLNSRKYEIIHDIQEHSLLAAVLCYLASHYTYAMMAADPQQEIDEDIIDIMQEVFHLLVIGHGIHNKINLNRSNHKISSVMNVSNLVTLEFFLENAYHAWSTLFAYYHEHYHNKPLYAYPVNQIDLFEVLQACKSDAEILPLITNFYDKHNQNYDYEAILNYLELKLKLINHKLISIMPDSKFH